MLHSTDVVCTSHHESQAKRVSHRRDSFISFFSFFDAIGIREGRTLQEGSAVGRDTNRQSFRACNVNLAT